MSREQPPLDIPDGTPSRSSSWRLKASQSGPDDEQFEDQKNSSSPPFNYLARKSWLQTLLATGLTSERKGQIEDRTELLRQTGLKAAGTTPSFIPENTPTVISGKTVPKWLAERMMWNSQNTEDARNGDKFFGTTPTFEEVKDPKTGDIHIVERRTDPTTHVVFSELWWNKIGQPDRPGGKAAFIDRDPKTGRMTGEEYWVAFKEHRIGGPAIWHPGECIEYRQNGRYVNGPHGEPASIIWRPETGLPLVTMRWDSAGKWKGELGAGLFSGAPSVGHVPADATRVFLYSTAPTDGKQRAFMGPDGKKISYTDEVSVSGNSGESYERIADRSMVVGYGNASTPTFSLGPSTRMAPVTGN